MSKIETKITLSEKDIKALVAKEYNLDINSCNVSVSHYKGDAREPSSTTIIVEGSLRDEIINVTES